MITVHLVGNAHLDPVRLWNAADGVDSAVAKCVACLALAERTGRGAESVMMDPLTASVCSLQEIRAMVNEMFRKNKKHLPQFKTVKF